MLTSRTTILSISFACSLFFTPVAHAQTYTVTNIIDNFNNQRFSEFVAPSIATDGTIVFRAGLQGGGNEILLGSTAGISTLATETGQFSALQETTINRNGSVVFRANSTSGGIGIYNVTAGATTTVVETGAQFTGLGSPAVNDAGTVAFYATSGARQTISSVSNGTTATLVDSSSGFIGFADPGYSINTDGTLAFLGTRNTGSQAIGVMSGGATTILADTSGIYDRLSRPILNNAGSLVFSAALDNGDQAIYSSTGGVVSKVLDTTGEFAFLQISTINNTGTIAFSGALDAGFTEGLFAILPSSASPVAVVKIGDPLLDSTVQSLRFEQTGLNDNNQIAFSYGLANGRQGVAVASLAPAVEMPEAGTLTLLLPAFVSLGAVVVRRRNQGVSG